MNNTRKISLASAGKFHAFFLASEYASVDKLNKLYASHRNFIPPKNVNWRQYQNRLDLAIKMRMSALKYTQENRAIDFDNWLVKKISNETPHIIHSWTENSYHLFSKLKQNEWLKCLERSCPHSMVQYELIAEEADRLGVPYEKDRGLLQRNVEELYLADVIVVPSSYSAQSYSDPELIKKVRINNLGANFKYKERVQKSDKLIILMVGNNFLRKGSHYLIEAFKMIGDPNAELWIRGNVPVEYRTKIDDKRIKIIPPLLPSKLAKLYELATVFVQPSIDEGFGMTSLEALAFGLPLIISENVGAKDILNDQVSISVPIRDSEEIFKAIYSAIKLPSLKFDLARKKIIEENSWKACAERMIKSVYV